jgi:hypothetical protein
VAVGVRTGAEGAAGRTGAAAIGVAGAGGGECRGAAGGAWRAAEDAGALAGVGTAPVCAEEVSNEAPQ